MTDPMADLVNQAFEPLPDQRAEFERRFGIPWPSRWVQLEAELAEERRHHARCEAEYAAPAVSRKSDDELRRERIRRYLGSIES